MKQRPITIRQRPLKAIFALADGRIRLRRPADGLYKNVSAGDVLWLREQFYLPSRFNSKAPSQAEGPGVSPVFAVDLAGKEPKELGLGVSRPSHTLPRFWSRCFFTVEATELQPVLDITEEEARAEGFSAREFWLKDWDDQMTSITGRMATRLSEYNPKVLVMDLQLHREPLDGPRKKAA